MVRPLILALLLVSTAPVHASEGLRAIGLFPPAGAPLPLVDSKIDVMVRGPMVEATVTQRFRNASDRATEATYIFPLPLDAAVSAMAIHVGNRTIHAAIERREDAQRRYEDAIRAGVAGAQLDQERVDVFTQSVAAIPARGEVTITLRFDTVARFQDGRWELALPLVVAPRYVPGTATGRGTTGSGRAPDTDRAPDASRVTPPGSPGAGGPTQVMIHFADKPTELTSPTHELAQRGSDAMFTDPKTDHDAVVRWKTAAAATGWIEPAADGAYAAVVLTAPPAPPRKAGPLRLLLILDRSATAQGDAQAVARPTVRALLGALTASDRVAVAGSDTVPWGAPGDVARTLDPSWTRPAGAFDLSRVLAAAKPGGAPIVLVTGGLVADDAAAVTAARKLGVAVHVIGVGPAPARGALTQIAGASGGTVRFAVPGDDLGALARAVVADAASAAAPLAVNWGTLAATDVVPGILPRLGSGQAILVLARVKRAQTANVRARGELFAIETITPRAAEGQTTAMGTLARRWARNRLDELLATRADATVVAAHALRFGLVSPYTSLVAIGDEVIVKDGVKRSVAVPVSVPSGMKWPAVKQETTVELEQTHSRNIPPAQPPQPVTVTGREPTIDPGSTNLDDSKPAKKKPKKAEKTERPSGGSGGGDSDAKAEDEEGEGRARLPSPEPPSRTAFASESGGEMIEVMGAPPGMRRRWRLTTSVAGGLVQTGEVQNTLIVLGGRFELGGRTLAGLDASLWLVDGAQTIEGRALVTVARRGLARWFELGGGFGLHFGEEGTGPAAALSLRFHVPPLPRAATYLRYDAALLFDAATRTGQNTFTLGLEWGF